MDINELKEPLLKHPTLGKPLLHNKFGCFCLQGNKLQKAMDHFTKALELIQNKPFFTNIFQNIGNVYAQERNYDEAIKYYQMVIEHSPHNPESPLKDSPELPRDILLHKSLNSFDAFVDAHTNLAVMHLTKNETEKALHFCSRALELKKENFEAAINFGDILRQVGQRENAIKFTWDLIEKHTRASILKSYEIPKPIDCLEEAKEEEAKVEEVNGEEEKPKKDEEKRINVLCVKWGTRYNSEYVNKLYRGVKRNTTWTVDFYCLTDDPSGLSEGVRTVKLKEDWKGWWGKATLFSQDYGIEGKMFFIDLDMIITGSLDSIFEYKGAFGILKTDEFACEKKNKEGYNSSVLIWSSRRFEPIYLELKRNFEGITKYIVRFDFWLEMMVKNADFLQDLFPGQIADYLSVCQEKVPENVRIVCFPRSPKPDTCNSEWVKEHWI